MKLIVSGGLGHISQPLTQTLVRQGHAVVVISSQPERKQAIEALGAIAAIGKLEDVDFLTNTLTGADALYCMTPPNHMAEADYTEYNTRIAANYAKAIRPSGVKRVVHLSSYGAHLDKGTGLILGKYFAEAILNELPGVSVTHLRPSYFYYNLYSLVDMIRYMGAIRVNYGDSRFSLVSPVDIAAVAAEEVVRPGNGNDIRYIASDELTGQEVASILGAAIGKPDLQWEVISDEAAMDNLLSHGVPQHIANYLVEMFSCLRSGKLSEDYNRHRPELGKVKLTEFAKEFAAAFK